LIIIKKLERAQRKKNNNEHREKNKQKTTGVVNQTKQKNKKI
jgi:hypothetical protein